MSTASMQQVTIELPTASVPESSTGNPSASLSVPVSKPHFDRSGRCKRACCPHLSPALRNLLFEVAYAVAWCTAYFGTGCAFYMTVQGWNIWESLYFLMVTASTVGYGDLSPDSTKPGAQFFTLIYILFGVSVVFAQLSKLISKAFTPLFDKSRATFERLFPQKGIDIDGDGEEDFKVPRRPAIYYTKNMLAPFVVIISVQCFFAAIFTVLEDWTFGTALYHCLVTATTVGYGDTRITNDSARMWAFFHIAISVSLLTAIIADFGELKAQRTAALKKISMLKGSLDIDLMRSLDIDGDGVDKFEFVIGMLAKLDAVNMEDVESFVKLFESMDVDGNGKLDHEDMARGCRERATTFQKLKGRLDDTGVNDDTVGGLTGAVGDVVSVLGDSLGSGPVALGLNMTFNRGQGIGSVKKDKEGEGVPRTTSWMLGKKSNSDNSLRIDGNASSTVLPDAESSTTTGPAAERARQMSAEM
mmetsp:Transcript_5550/g.14665  ORF Transcript_5550/g.14665 Transcript_5550/m.14665 type:complete len:473 (+) Transcript_5550:42-1460(+)